MADKFTTPVNKLSRLPASIARSSAIKRDSLAAELERGECHLHLLHCPCAGTQRFPPTGRLPSSAMPDPQLSTAKRQQRTQTFASHLASASLERQLIAAQTARTELETKLREKDVLIERLEGDRRWLSERETEEREEKERERAERAEEKVRSHLPTPGYL